jgi:hypothetical protein
MLHTKCVPDREYLLIDEFQVGAVQAQFLAETPHGLTDRTYLPVLVFSETNASMISGCLPTVVRFLPV